ncbi:MAG: ParB N-terminal domain-containing protein [Nitrososphaeria archaeon]
MSSSKELLSYRLELLKINEVRPHEEVKIRNLSEIMNSIKQIGLQLDPVIVDEKTNVALDGMHRIKAIRELQLKRIMVARVDYSDPKIGLERWLRAIKSPSISKIEELKVALKLKRVESTTAAMEMVDSGESSIALITEKMGLVSSIRRSGIERFSLIREFDRRVLDLETINDFEMQNKIKSGYAVLYVPKPTKEEVVESGLTGRLFPPKSTKHIIPLRPVNVRCPIELLNGRMSDSEATSIFQELLNRMAKKMMPAGSLYAGRVYNEPLVLYNP